MGKIESIEVSDLREIRKLLLSRWPDIDEWFDKETIEFFLRRCPEYCIKFCENKKILGLALGSERHRCLRLHILLVNETQKGKGVGTELIRYLEKMCRKNKFKAINISSGERDYATGAFNFYTKNGFKVVGFRQTYKEKSLFFEKVL